MTKLGKYEILQEIGRGGFAVVYKARDTTLERVIALKVLHHHVADDPTFIQRFYQEARTAARLRHPKIATVFEVGEEAGQHYLAMTFLPGQTLDAVLESAREPLPLEQAISIVEQVAGALEYIHGRGLVHRDVKPSNIIVDDAGQATLLDFGIVRAADGTQLTTTGAVMGTPQYMSPEQAEGKEIDPRSDIYSLGVLAYQMCTGRAPFDHVSPLVVLRLHADKSPPSPRVLNAHLPVEVEQVLLKALAKKREERYQSASEMARALREAMEAAEQARRREGHLAELYERLQAAVATQDWGEVVTLGERIRALDHNYRDVAELVEEAHKHLRRPRRPSVAAWAWGAGAVGLLILVALGVALAPRLLEAISLAPETATEQPVETPAEVATEAPAKTPAEPTLGPLPTSTPKPTATPTEEPTPERTEAPVLSARDILTRPADGMVMVYVPAGEFEMGLDDDDLDNVLQLCDEYYGGGCERESYEDEQPVHTVALDGFWIDRTEVTNAQYRSCVEAGVCKSPYDRSSFTRDEYYGNSVYGDYPVIWVSWHQARTYCEWAGARLPTEAEWEYAARGPDSFDYPWGNSSPSNALANYGRNVGDTTRVGSYPDGASWCGALDMAGNVWERVTDWYGGYPSERQVNPTGPSSGDYRGARGGSWPDGPHRVRGAYRGMVGETGVGSNGGFRCATSSE